MITIFGHIKVNPAWTKNLNPEPYWHECDNETQVKAMIIYTSTGANMYVPCVEQISCNSPTLFPTTETWIIVNDHTSDNFNRKQSPKLYI